jgi:hypothetical protein
MFDARRLIDSVTNLTIDSKPFRSKESSPSLHFEPLGFSYEEVTILHASMQSDDSKTFTNICDFKFKL